MYGELKRKYEIEPASFFDDPFHELWIRTLARDVDLGSEDDVNLVKDLDVLLRGSLDDYSWVAVASNNLKWNATETPIMVMVVPDLKNEKYITLVNTSVTILSDDPFLSVEGCGTLTEYKNGAVMHFPVPRSRVVEVKGYLFEDGEFREVTLTYDSDPNGYEHIAPTSLVQHEQEHLEGDVIMDRSNFLKWISYDEDLAYANFDIEKVIEALEMPLSDITVVGSGIRDDGWYYEIPDNYKLPRDYVRKLTNQRMLPSDKTLVLLNKGVADEMRYII